MELLRREREALHLLRWHLPTGRVAGGIPRRPAPSALRRWGVAEQGHDDLTPHPRAPAPLLGPVAAPPVLQLVPRPRPRGPVAYREA
jgi:hypothetical protein